MDAVKVKTPICIMDEKHGNMNVITYQNGHNSSTWQFFIEDKPAVLFVCEECGCVVARNVDKLEKIIE